MKEKVPYEDAVDLLDADHKAVKKMFIDYTALCEDQALADDRRVLALKIGAALTVHAQIEGEIFYPAVFFESTNVHARPSRAGRAFVCAQKAARQDP